tara:strand:- start:725 stop:1141 length:417 start_codon:yes stop_codon:yes gene_type:complete
MQRKILITAAALGMFSVIIGAWAAHGIETFIPDADPNKIKKIASFKVGVRYQFYHAFLLLFLGLIPKEYFNKRIVLVFILTLVGVVLFSFSIYLLSLKSQLGLESLVPILGPITPIGGLTLTIAWGVLIIYGIKLKKN